MKLKMHKAAMLLAMAAHCAIATAHAAETAPKKLTAEEKAEQKKNGSNYVQCDGNPNNMSAGETIARLIGIVALIGLFAPSPEAPDASKRKFGEAGVAACSKLLDDPSGERNVVRRIPLMLARAIHHIEAKNYAAAVDDVGRARAESATNGLAGDPYFERSVGLSFDLIEAEAFVRMGEIEKARGVSLAKVQGFPHGYYPLITARDYGVFAPEMSETERLRLTQLGKIVSGSQWATIRRYAETNRFTEAAALNDDLVATIATYKLQDSSSMPMALSAVLHALAGSWDAADTMAKSAQSNMTQRRDAGKAENDIASVVEVLDLYNILKLAKASDLAVARRNFAARSQWFAPYFGAVAETNRRLREGAKPEELFGSLEKTPEQMWAARRDEKLASFLETDKDNRTLFSMILPYAKVEGFERLSKDVWRKKSKWLNTENPEGTGLYHMYVNGDSMTQVDALMLHSALQAKERGVAGFTFLMVTNSPSSATVRFGNIGDPGLPASLFIDADTVIAELRQIIPPPEEVKARKMRRDSATKKKSS